MKNSNETNKEKNTHTGFKPTNNVSLNDLKNKRKHTLKIEPKCQGFF